MLLCFVAISIRGNVVPTVIVRNCPFHSVTDIFLLVLRAAGFQFSDEEIAEFLDQFDKDGDGQLDQSGERTDKDSCNDTKNNLPISQEIMAKISKSNVSLPGHTWCKSDLHYFQSVVLEVFSRT